MSTHEPLKAAEIFADFDDQEIADFAAAADRRSVPEGHSFFAMGAANTSLYVVCGGAVRVERIGVADHIPLATLGAGQTFGEMSFMDGSLTTAAVVAAEPTEVLEISRPALDRLLSERPAMCMKLWRNLALELKQRLAKTDELIDHYIDVNQTLLEDAAFREYFSRV
jgi:CRP-like cAMP-binding protein